MIAFMEHPNQDASSIFQAGLDVDPPWHILDWIDLGYMKVVRQVETVNG